MNKYFNSNQRIGEIAVKLPVAMEVFKKYNIDFCCGGDRVLKTAIEEQQLDETTVINELNETYDKYVVQNNKEIDWTKETYASLIEYIVSTHHRYLEETLPRLNELTIKILRVHGENHIELEEVQKLFEDLKTELLQHLVKEEEQVFPLMVEYEKNREEKVLRQALKNIDELEAEHEGAGHILKDLRKVTNGYAVPQDGCNTYKITYKLLKDVESDTFKHIHLENNILFPALKKQLQ